ncbi:Zn-dependent peptidase ImmA (M78 family) [Dysgonomonadaceae bacterium PH5-43]|nr:Zn-dependent peptidase ImmA (M78 family) [Dysgonomonadaceae bacterium PH5-43]
MKKISSVEKGDIFEKEVFELLKSKLSNDELFLNGKMSKIFHKKAYYSRDRESNIIVDIAIETTMPNANGYSILTVFECKNYGENTVPISDIEEFALKLSQIAGYNVKGVMITSSQYSSNTLTLARNKGIGLYRLFQKELTPDTNRKSRFGEQSISENVEAVICGETSPTNRDYIFDYRSFDNILSYFLYLNIIDQKPKEREIELKVPFLSLSEIEQISEQMIGNSLLETVQPTSLASICSKLEKECGMKFIIDEDLGYSGSKEILGKISFSSPCIYITKNLKSDGHRWRFTLAHEIGHHILHSKILSKTYQEAIDTENSIDNEIVLDNKSLKRIEFQANIFASALLMPAKSFLQVTQIAFSQNRVNRGRLYLDNQPCNRDLFYRVANEISTHFNVSIEAVKYRLIAHNLMENHNGMSLRDILN